MRCITRLKRPGIDDFYIFSRALGKSIPILYSFAQMYILRALCMVTHLSISHSFDIWLHMTALALNCAFQYHWHHLRYCSVRYSHSFHISVTIKMIRTPFMLTLSMRKDICFNFILRLNRYWLLSFTINTSATALMSERTRVWTNLEIH